MKPGDGVFIRDQECHGKIIEKLKEPRSYKASTDNGTVVRRNRKSLIHTGLEFSSKNHSPGESACKSAITSKEVLKSSSSSSVVQPSAPPSDVAATSVENHSGVTACQQSRSGRVIKCNRQPDMVYYKWGAE